MDSCINFFYLMFLDALCINMLARNTNDGLKVSHQLVLLKKIYSTFITALAT